MKQRQTVILIHNTLPDSYGGAESYQLKLAEELKKLHYRPIIVTSSKRLITLSKKSGCLTISAPFCKNQNWSSWRNLLLPFYALWQLYLYIWYRRLFRRYRPLAVDIQSRDDFIAATLAAKKLKIKTFWTDHADFRVWILVNVHIKYKNFIGKWILRTAPKADRIIFISEFEYRHFKKITRPRHFSNLTIIKNGTPDHLAEFRNITPAQSSICYLGRLVEDKGINELLQAFRLLHEKHPEATLNLYGDGDVAIISEAKSIPGVTHHGFTDDPLSAIASSELFVLPSYHEGLSLSLLEAAMLGRAIVATNIDGNPEVILDRNTGLLVPPRDHQALASALCSILEHPTLLNKLSKNVRLHYERNFDFSKNVKQLCALFEEENAI